MSDVTKSDDSKRAGLGALLTAGGLGTVKGTTEYQHRQLTAARRAEAAAVGTREAAIRSRRAANDMKGKRGAAIRDLQGRPTRRTFTAQMQREAADNLEAGVRVTERKAKVARRIAGPRVRNAQRGKIGGLAALAAGTYLGAKGLAGMERNRGVAKAWPAFRAAKVRPHGAVDREKTLHRVLTSEMKAGTPASAKATYAEQRLKRLAKKKIKGLDYA